jgi:hypothetical protein
MWRFGGSARGAGGGGANAAGGCTACVVDDNPGSVPGSGRKPGSARAISWLKVRMRNWTNARPAVADFIWRSSRSICRAMRARRCASSANSEARLSNIGLRASRRLTRLLLPRPDSSFALTVCSPYSLLEI